MPDDKIIDFTTAKEPHVHARRDKKVDEMRKAFESYLNDGQDSRQQRRKKERDKAKKKKR